MSFSMLLLYAILALPIVLVVLALLLKWRRSSYPSWLDVDPAVLKVGGSAKKLEAAADADVIVIGSGLGGLTSAAVLSKAGYNVVVLEQHDVIGGATHTFEDGGFEFDVGIHYLGGEMDTWLSPVRRLFAAVSDGKLEWTACDANFDVCHNASSGESIPFCGKSADNEARIASAKSFKDHKPGAVTAALRAYRRAETLAHLAGAVMVAFKALPPAALRLAWPLLAPLWRRYGCATVAEVCEACGMTGPLASLSGVVSYLYGDYGVHPSRAPMFLHAFVTTHYNGGAFFPTGGSASIAKTLVAAIVRRGGACFVRAPVTEITVDEASGRAVGVVARGVALRARVAVISDAGFRNTFGSADADRAVLMGTPRAAAAALPRSSLLPPDVGAKQRVMLQTMHGDEEAAEEEQQAAKALEKVRAILKETGAEEAWEEGAMAKETTTAAAAMASPAEAKEKPKAAAAATTTEPPSRDVVDGSIAMVYLFVGLDASDEELGIAARNTWVLRDYDADGAFAHFEALELPDDGSIVPRADELPAVFVGAASAKDADWPRRHPGKAALTVLAPVRADWFDRWAGGKIKSRGAEYAACKEAWRALLLQVLYAHVPQAEGHVVYTDVGTPLSNDFYLGSVRGEVYGLAHVVERYSRRDAMLALHPQTSVPGLYLTGQDSLFVGVVSALMSGLLTATRVSYVAGMRCLLEIVLS